MINLLWNRLRAFLFDEKVAAASLRSFITFLAATASIIIASASDATGHINMEIIRSWDWEAWVTRLGVAAVAAAAIRIRAGDKNLTPEEIQAAAKAPPVIP